MLYYERKFRKNGYNFIIGVDEVGRGPLAGPVVAAAVILNTFRFDNRIDDSKKLTAKSREMAFPEIVRKSVFGVGIISERIIDRINILQATRLAMYEAISIVIKKLDLPKKKSLDLKKDVVHIIVDGNMGLVTDFSSTDIVGGDARSMTIACASILAKVIRDRIMNLYDRLYPEYGFARHKGYGTNEHRQALKRHGLSLIHRRTFCAH